MASLTTLGLRIFAATARWGDRPAWLGVLGVTLALLAGRIAVMTAAARRHELPWPRLLLPGILLIEGIGVWWGVGAGGWQLVRPTTAVVLELAFIALAIRELRRGAEGNELPEARLARPLTQLLPPRAARLVAFELYIMGSALRFVCGGWRRPPRDGFTYHRESTLRMLLPLLPLLLVADIALLELVILPRTRPWIRIAVHALAVYGVIWLIGLWASFRGRPHIICDGRATLYRGLLCHLELPLDQIASIGAMPAFSDDWKRRAYRKRAIRVDIAGPTALDIRLHAPIRAIGILGPGPARDHVIVAVDDPTAFLAALGRG